MASENGPQGTRDDDVTRPTLDHVRKHVVHILHHDIDIQVQHPVDSRSVGIDQSPRRTYRICMQDVELACLLQDSRSSVAQSLGSSRSMTRGITARRACCRAPSALLVAVDHHHARACANIASVLAIMPDAAPVTTATLPSNSLPLGVSLLVGRLLLAPADCIAPNGDVTPPQPKPRSYSNSTSAALPRQDIRQSTDRAPASAS